MYRLVILGIIGTALAAVDKRECEKIFDPHATHCCKKTAELKEHHMKSEKLKDCFQMSMDPALCEHELCVAKKEGFATDDNKLDMKKLEGILTKDFGSYADLIKDIKTKCFDGDLVEYGPPDFCDFFKMKLCITAQMLKNCPEWNDNDVCNEFKGLVQECGKTIF